MSFDVTVENVDPEVGVTGDVIDEGGIATIEVTLSDVGTLDKHTIDIDWGLGETPDLGVAISPGETTFTHQYLDDNPTGTLSDDYTVGVTVTDDDVDQEVTRYAERLGQTPAAVRAQLDKDNGLAALAEGLRREKTVELLLSRATIVTA